ncbi:MAG: sugar ABC transporter permease, partial [Candidatus Atribacteria bacterium]|nr:sugar ABC transporter permease [Candidatus Atribacteria bacterium]
MIDRPIHNHSLKKRLSLFFLEKKNGVAYLLLVPSLVLIFGILIYPLLYSLFISFHDYLLTKPGIYNFIGLANYLEALQSSFFLKSVIRTLYFAFVTVGVELFLGLGVALVLQQKFRGRGLVRGLIILPWALPTSVNGIMWKWIYNANYGVLNALL